jgi:hypothetical protein
MTESINSFIVNVIPKDMHLNALVLSQRRYLLLNICIFFKAERLQISIQRVLKMFMKFKSNDYFFALQER